MRLKRREFIKTGAAGITALGIKGIALGSEEKFRSTVAIVKKTPIQVAASCVRATEAIINPIELQAIAKTKAITSDSRKEIGVKIWKTA